MKYFDQVLQIDPANVHAINNRGVELQGQGHHDDAIACYKKALSIDRGYARAYYNLGNALKNNFTEAKRNYRIAIQLKPTYADAHYALGIVFWKEENFVRAAECYRAALKHKRKFPDAHVNLGIVLRARNDSTGAIFHYRQAIRIDPDFAKAHYNLGFVLQEQGDSDGAIKCYHKAICCNADYFQAHVNLAFLLKAKAKHSGAIKYRADAIKHFRKAALLRPNNAVAHYNLGNTLLVNGDTELGIKSLRTAVKLDPRYAQAWWNLGRGLTFDGQFEPALAALQRGRQLGANVRNAAYYVNRCEQLLKLSRHEKLEPVSHKNLAEGIQSRLSADLPIDIFRSPGRSYRKAYAVQLKKGISYQIDLTGDFDTYLRIENKGYKGLLFNNDVQPPGNRNSRLAFTAPRDGIYRLVVTSFPSEVTGSFTLKIRKVMTTGAR